VIGPGAPIVLPPETAEPDYEAELGVVIGRTTRRVDAADALSYVAGYTWIATGTPPGVGFARTPPGVGFARTPPGWLSDGDVVEVEIEGIGVLANPVATER
jgi:acylpyruvate hydrolase